MYFVVSIKITGQRNDKALSLHFSVLLSFLCECSYLLGTSFNVFLSSSQNGFIVGM